MSTRDLRDVYAGLKDFQLATVDHVAKRFYGPDPTDRFLVADEVGLGKTLVARGVIARTIEHHLREGTDRIDIVYICSNGDIARQNINKLNVLGHDDVELASRITLLPRILHQLQDNPINFVSFTPGTSFNLRSSQGVANERVLLYHLVADIWPDEMRGAGARKTFSGWAAFDNFHRYLNRMSREELDDAMADGFRNSLESEDRRLAAVDEPTYRERLRQLTEGLRWVRRNSYDAIPNDLWNLRSDFIGGLREILAKVCVDALEPDLVILDEFQRFKHVFDEERPEGQLANRLFTYAGGDGQVKVLLLSATPYRMYTLTEEEHEDHYADFVDTLRFLLPAAEVDALAGDLRAYRQALWRISDDQGAAAGLATESIERHLRSVMCRTERLAVTADRDGMLTEMPTEGVQLVGPDVHRYLTLEQVSDEIGGYGMLPFWLSTAYPLNFMESYKVADLLDDQLEKGGNPRLRELLGRDELLLSWEDVTTYEHIDPGNARMRGLLRDTVERGAWRLLWMPPSLPYYQLGEPFDVPQLRDITKRLVFSSWTVVPKAVAALTTYEAERRMMRSFSDDVANTPDARSRITELLRFQRTQGRPAGMTALALLYPSTVLAEVGDPLVVARQLGAVDRPLPRQVLLREVERAVSRQLAPLLADSPTDGGADLRWYWAAPFLLDHRSERDDYLEWLDPTDVAEQMVWESGDEHSDESVSQGLVAHLEEAVGLLTGGLEPLGRPPDDLAEVIAELAVAGPGVVALRTLERFGLSEVEDDDAYRRDYATHIAWGLRSLFNEPEVQYLLRSAAGSGQREDAYWRLVLRYCLDGCLQSVLDEYVHMLLESRGLLELHGTARFDPLVEEIREVLTMRTTSYRVREVEVGSRRVRTQHRRMRGHFAVRFGDDKSEDEKSLARSSTVRKAFNSPFRPFVLATTSVGQEGLDFHTYCHAVVHWNLPSNPVDMEQREGRVHRYKGHAVRKNVAQKHRAAAFDGDADPWRALFAQAAADSDGDSDLTPFWVYTIPDGARIERYVPALPLSRDARQLERLRRSMAAYRLVFGQPRQQDLVAFLSSHLDEAELRDVLDDLRIDLTPPPIAPDRREELLTAPTVSLPERSARDRAAMSGGSKLSPRRQKYEQFWSQLLSDIKREFPGWTTAKPSTESWMSLPAGISGIFYALVFASQDRLRIELYVDPWDEDLRDRAWSELMDARESIERSLGESLTWEPLPDARASRIAWYYPHGPAGIDRESEWGRYRSWLLTNLGPFRGALQPVVDDLRRS